MNTFLFTCLYIHLHIYRHPWDVWSSLALNIHSRPEWRACPYSPYFFFSFSKTTSPTDMALYCDCATTDLRCCLIHPVGSLESDKKIWDNEKFQCGSVSLKEGFLVWFDVSLWHKYETTCQHAELEQIIFLKICLKCLHKPRVVKSAQCYSRKKLDF